ncbi:unnamed protein product, partial [Porites lobata]
ALQAGNTLRGVIYGAAAVSSGVLCHNMAKKLGGFKHVWNEVNTKRTQYQEIHMGLESLKEVVGRELKEGIHLIGTPDFSVLFILICSDSSHKPFESGFDDLKQSRPALRR